MRKILLLGFSLISSLSFSQIVINEYSCSNRNGITDFYGENEDWIELYNTSGVNIDLTGFYLSDKANNLTKWQIPSGNIAGNARLVIQCSGRDEVQGTELHPNFRLTQTKNEWIILADPSGAVMDSINIVHMAKEDHSVGRSTDGAVDWKLFLNPTPNAPNVGAINFYTSSPSMSLPQGFYTGAQTVTLSCPDAGAIIRYTLDGSEPTAASPAYGAAINIATTTVVRAKAFSTNEESFIVSNTYFINENHTLPVISICGAGVYDMLANGNGFNSEFQGNFELYEDDQSFKDEGEGMFDKHGNDSWAYDQRGFDFVMRDQLGYDNEISHQIFPNKSRDGFQRLILKPAANDNYPFEDGAHIRDAFVHTLSQKADMKMDERTWKPCILYLNGEYWGVYEIRERVDDSDFTDYYYGQDKYNLQYLKTWGATWARYGGQPAIDDWDDFVVFVQGNNMGTPANFYIADSLLNWKSLVDYFVLNSFIVSQDWLNWNTAWWRGRNPIEDKKKWRYTLWDMDASFGHYINYTGIPDPSANADPCNVENLPDPGGQGHTTILQKLINENPVVEQYYKARYIDMANTHFSCPSMNALLDSMINEIAPEMPGQIAKWGGTVAGWQANVQELKDFIDARCAAIQDGLIDCYNLTGPFDVTVDVSPAGAGEVKLNSIWVPSYPWSGVYYGNINTLMDAKANAGFTFHHWEYTTGPLSFNDSIDTNIIDFQGNETLTAIFKVEEGPEPPVYGSHSVNIPTGFTPGVKDNHNDFLRPIVGEDVASFRLLIYDRWGNRIISTVDPLFAWDGTFNGKELGTGIYAYSLEIVYKDGTQEEKSGNITLMR